MGRIFPHTIYADSERQAKKQRKNFIQSVKNSQGQKIISVGPILNRTEIPRIEECVNFKIGVKKWQDQ